MQRRLAASRRSTTRWGVVIMLAASILVAAGCGSDDDDGGSATTSGATPTTSDGATTSSGPATTAAPTTTDAGVEYVDDAEVKLAGVVVGQDFDPHKAGGTLAGIVDVYDPLIRPLPDFQLEPALATAWEFTDDTTLRLTLREGVTFHDGSPFNADAVVASLDRARGGETSQHKESLKSISEVVKVDDFTVDIKLTEPDATIVNVLSTPASFVINPKMIGDESAILAGAAGIGTGPYTLKEYVPTTLVVVERYDDYWDPARIEHAPKTMRFDVVDDGNARLNGLQTGEYDGIQWVGTPGLSGDDGLIATNDDYVANITPALNVRGFAFNPNSAPFNDVKVRLAFAHALDMPALLDGLLADEIGCRAEQPTQLPSEGQIGYDPDLKPLEYDVEKAKQLLAEAGYPDGEGFPDIRVSAASAANDTVAAQAFFEMLGEIGIDNITLDEQPSRVFILAEFQAGKSQAVLINIAQGAGVDPAFAFNNGVLAPPFVDDSPAGQQFKSLLADARTELDPAARTELYSQASQLALDNAFYVPYCSTETGYATTSNITSMVDSIWLKSGVPEAVAIRVLAD